MTPDDNESDSERSTTPEPTRSPLPPDVERALAKARAAVDKAQQPPAPKGNQSRWLALIPLTAGLLMMLLMMPREAPPEDVPLPQIDQRVLAAIRKDDTERAAAARTTRLAGGALLVGTSLRALNKAHARNASPEEIGVLRITLDVAYRAVVTEEQSTESLRTLRALQLETFLAEVERFEATGQPSEELEEIAGGFVARMSAAGWLTGHTVVLDDAQRRAAYKLVWTATIGADRAPGLALSLDEQRVLYTLYLTHPHAAESQRTGYEARRRIAATPEECAKAIAVETLAVEQWRAEKVKRLGELDPTYPTAFALGVAHYRAGRYDLSMEDFRTWIATHPDGPLSLRARNHMKAALAMSGS